MATVQLPAENLENIFCYLDGKSFCKVREVCKAWSRVIKELQKKRTLWRQFCIQEIPLYILEEILSFKFVPFDCPCLNWSSLYKKWYKTRRIVEAPFLIKTIDPSVRAQPSITSIRLSGDWIITGHSSGHLSIWNQYSGELAQRCLCHLKTVVDIALIDLLNLGSYYGEDDSPWDHHHAITISRDSYIQVIPLLEKITTSKITHLHYHSTDLTGIRVFGTSFAVSSSDNIISIWGMKINKEPYFHLNTTLLSRIIGPTDSLFNLGLWHDQIYCTSYSGKLKVYDSIKEEWHETMCLKNTYLSESVDRIITVTKSYLFRDRIVILFTSDARMVISIGERFNNQYYLMRHLQTLVTSVELRGTIFALGGENGRIYLFHVPETQNLLELDLSSPSFSRRLSEASITSLDILCDTESPVIVASTNESIFVIKWYSSASSHQVISERNLF